MCDAKRRWSARKPDLLSARAGFTPARAETRWKRPAEDAELRSAARSAPSRRTAFELMGRRTKARECALQMLYQWDITREPMDRVTESFWRVRSTTDETRAMAERLARGAREHVERIDLEITAASTNWRFERIAAVDRNILRVATYELMMEPATPSAVILDEAIEMAKRFGEAESSLFVNGVLDAIRLSVRAPDAPAEAKRR